MTSNAAGAPGSGQAALPPGTRLEEYRIERCLGGGGFGITYLAWDDHLQLPVAIKEYFPADMLTRTPEGEIVPGSTDDATRQRFEQGLHRFIDEARALASFRHPNIVRVLRYFRARGTAYIVMEYESGQPLKQWLAMRAPLTRTDLLAIALPLIDGLEAVHAAGFIHRDIKPDNIYVRSAGVPVLLDFGSARRRHTDCDMTQIVSPGFAPFEQYQAHGDQGPWSDLYGVGAVLYWMVTGRRPLEAEARMQADTLPPASAIGDAATFGMPVLQAIDWALRPQERQRPQSAGELRAALRGENRSVAPSYGSAPASSPAGPAPGRGNLLCTILFLDMVGYSERSVDDQAVIKRRLNALVTRAIQSIAPEERLVIDAGDGVAICFLGDPQDALQSTLLLRDLLEQRTGGALPVRFGLHMGPVRIVNDINHRINVIGDGINVAQRIMDLAQPRQILVSRACYDVISRIANDGARLFQYAGTHVDKHGRSHELHAVIENTGTVREADPPYSRTLPPGRSAAPSQSESPRSLPPQALKALEHALGRHIGPMAGLLVQQALASAGQDLERLACALAEHINTPREREAFRQWVLGLRRGTARTRLKRPGGLPRR